MNLCEYVDWIQSAPHEMPAGRSDLWSGFVESLRGKLNATLNSSDPTDLLRSITQLDRTLHYGFYFDESEQSLKEKLDLTLAVKKNLQRQLKQLDIPSSDERENIGSFVFLDSIGLFEEYLDLANTLRFVPDMSSARHFYYAHRLRGILSQRGLGPVRVLEIGAGAANLAMLLQHYGLVQDYTIIDLPEMLLMSGVNLELRARRKCVFSGFPPTEADQLAVYLLPASQDINQLPNEIFDLVLNFNSFSEMPPSVVDGYFHSIYRTAKSGAIFMNVNRIQEHRQDDGRIFEMNPLLFPYDNTDRILMWDVDPFQQFVRQFCRLKAVKSTAIMRVSMVRGQAL